MKKSFLFFLLMCLGTLAAQAGLDYKLGPVDFETGIPSTWTQQVMSDETCHWCIDTKSDYPTGAHSGSARVVLRDTAQTAQGYVTRLITNPIDLSTGNYVLEFAYAQCSRGGAFDTLKVYYSLDGNEWKILHVCNAQQNAWKVQEIDLIGNSSTYYIAFEAVDNFARGVVLDDISVYTKPNCQDVDNFMAIAGSRSAMLLYLKDAGATAQIVVDTVIHDMSTFVPSAANVFFYTETAAEDYTVTGLDSLHTYFAYIRTICDNNKSGFTNWVDMSFTTSAGFPFAESFVGGIPAHWQNMYGNLYTPVVNTSTTYPGWRASSNTTLFGAAHVCGNPHYAYSGGAIYTPTWLVSPTIDLTNVSSDAVELTFQLALAGNEAGTYTVSSASSCRFHVLISSDGGETWTAGGKTTFEGTTLSLNAKKIRVDLGGYKGNVIKIALVAECTTTSSAYFHVANLKVDEYDANCGDVREVSISDLTHESAIAHWTLIGKDSVQLELSEDEDFATIKQSETIAPADHQLLLTDLSSKTTYYVRVKQLCAGAEWVSCSFTTSIGLPFIEDFSGGTLDGWKFYQAADTVVFAGGTLEPTTSSDCGWTCTSQYSFNSSYLLRGELYQDDYYYYSSENNRMWAISPNVVLNNTAVGDSIIFSFDMAYTNRSGYSPSSSNIKYDHFRLLVSVDGGAWNAADSWLFDQSASAYMALSDVPTTGKNIVLDFSRFAGHTIRIAFYKDQDESSYAGNYLQFDNLKLKKIDRSCAGLTDLAIEPAITEAVARWAVKGDHVAKVQLSSSSTCADTIQMHEVNGIDTLLLTGLTDNTVYYLRAAQNCGDEEWSEIVKFRTHCNDDTIPYFTGFESDAYLEAPSCWTLIQDASYPYVTSGSSDAHTGSKYFTWGSGYNASAGVTYAALPAFTTPVSGMEMSFWIRRATSDTPDTIEIGVMTNPMDGTTFEKISQVVAKSQEYEQVFVSFVSYAGVGKYIAFKRLNSVKYPVYIDDVDIHALPACYRVGDVSLTTPSASGVTVKFVKTNAENFRIVFATESINPDTLDQVDPAKIVYNDVVAYTSGIEISDAEHINPNTTYYVYVRGECDTENGAWSKETSFTTLCAAIDVDEYGVETFSNIGNMACWKTGFSIPGTSTSTNYAVAGRVTDSKYGAYIKLSKESVDGTSYSYNDGAYAISPELDVDSIKHYQVTFSCATTSTAATNKAMLEVGVVTNPADMDTYETIERIHLNYAADSSSSELKEYEVDFHNYNGDYQEPTQYGKYVMFKSEAGTDKTNYVLIDNVSFQLIPACKKVNVAAIDQITSDGALYHWKSTGAGKYQVVVDTTVTKNVDTLAAPVFTQIVEEDTLLQITGLMSNTQYYAYVRGICGSDTARWSANTAFRTECGAIAELPWTEGFENMEKGTYSSAAPTCWSLLNANNGAYPYIYVNNSSTYVKTGSKSLYFVSSSSKAGYAVLPPFEAALNTLRVKFACYFESASYSGKLYVGYLTDPMVDTTFHSLQEVTRMKSWQNLTVDLNDIPDSVASTARLAFKYAPQAENYYMGIDDITVELLPTCPAPKNLAASEITTNSAVITWEGASASYDLYVLRGNDTVAIHKGLTEDSIEITDLEASTSYKVTLQGICTPDSSEVIEKSFKTVLGLPFVENFNSLTAGIPAGWNNSEGTTTYETSRWNYNDTGKDGACVRFDSYSNSSGNTNYLATPAIQFPVSDSITLSFDYKNPTGGDFTVLVSNDGGTTRDTLFTGLTSQSSWATLTKGLTQYGGSSVIIYFVGTSNYGSGDAYIYLDNVSIRESIFGCDDPTNVALSLLPLDTAIVTWQGDSAKMSVVQLANDVSFDHIVLTDTIEAGLVDTIAGIAHGQSFYARVQQLCEGDAKTAWVVAPGMIETACDPVAVLPWSKDFADATTSDIPKCWTVVKAYESYGSSYPYVSTTSHSLYFSGGTSYSDQIVALPEMAMPVSGLTLNMTYDSDENTSYSTYGKLIVGVMNELNEESFIALDTLDQSDSKIAYELVLSSAPATAKYVAIRYALGSSSYGSANVYNLSLTQTPRCLPMKSIEFENVDRREMDILWTPKAESTAYDLVISEVALTDSALAEVTPITVDTTAYHATGLTRNTLYYIYVRANCGEEDGVSAWISATVKTKSLQACDDYIVGQGTSTDYLFPYNNYHKNSWNQMIYSADKLGGAMDINAIAFEIANTGSLTSDNLTIYMAHTSKTVASSSSDWINQADLVQVYSGTNISHASEKGWEQIELNAPFKYNGSDNLAVIVAVKASSYATSLKYKYTSAANGVSMYRRSDNDQTCGDYPSAAGTLSTELPNVKFVNCYSVEACPAVETITHELVGDGTSQARIAWTASAGDYANLYSVVYADSLITDWTEVVPQIDSIQALDTIISGLEAYTDYYVYVIAHCNGEGQEDGSSVWSAPYMFKTNSSCLIVNDLSFVATDKTEALATWKADFEDKNFVYILSDSLMSDADLEQAAKQTATDTFLVFSGLQYNHRYFLYVAHNCGEGGLSPFMMDSLTTSAACPAVENLQVINLNANTVNVAWESAEFGEETEWEVGLVGRENVAQRVATPQAFIIGMEPETDYTVYVKAICSESEQSVAATLAIHTPAVVSESQIGSGTGTLSTLPTSLYHKYSTSEQIYTASEIGTSGTINTLSFKFLSTPSSNKSRDITIYMKHVTKSEFASTSDWETVTTGDQVYNGSITFTPNAWNKFELQRPFAYNGDDNLLIIVDDNSGSYMSSGLNFAAYTVSNTASLYSNSDSDNIDPKNPTGSGSLSTSKNQIKLGFEQSSCPKVKNLAVADITINSASFSWLPGGGEVAWAAVLSDSAMTTAQLDDATADTLTYKMDTIIAGLTPDKDYFFYISPVCSAESSWKSVEFTTLPTCMAPIEIDVKDVIDTAAVLMWQNATEGFAGTYRVAVGLADQFDLTIDSTYVLYEGLTADSLLINTLTALSSYSFAVQEVCSESDTSRWSAIESFTTACGRMAIPWSESFDNLAALSDMSCWELPAKGVSLYEYSTYVRGESGKALKFATTDSVVVVLPNFGDLNGLQMTFWYRAEGTGTNMTMGTFQGGYVTDPTDSTSFVAIQNFGRVYEYEKAEIPFVSGIPAGARPAIRYHEATGESWFGFIDDVQMDSIPKCFKPILAVDSATETSITFHCGDSADYVAQIATDINFQNLVKSDTLSSVDTITFTNLSVASTYFIRAKRLCEEESESEWSATFKQATACALITSFPFSEDFNALTEGIPACWDNSKGTMTNESYKWTYYASGKTGACVRMDSYYASNGTNSYLATPEISIDTTLILTFDYKNPKGGDFSVLASADGTSFTTLASGLTGKSDWTKKEIMLDRFKGQIIRIYFKGTSNYGNSQTDNMLYLDNVIVNTYNANCMGVDSIKVDNIGVSSADLHYYIHSGSKDAYIEVASDNAFANIIANDTVRGDSAYSLVGLNACTMYYVRVKQLCGEGEESAFAIYSFTTAYGVRYAPVFASATIPSDWNTYKGLADDVFTNPTALTKSTYSGWSLTTADTIIPSYHFKGNIYGDSWNNWVVTPSIDLTPNLGEGLLLQVDLALVPFSAARRDAMYTGEDDKFMIIVSEDDGATWTAANATIWSNDSTANYLYNAIPEKGTTYRIDMSKYAGKVIKIAFYGESTEDNADNYFHFGNIILDRVETVNYIGDVCDREDYDGEPEGVPFYIQSTEYKVGLNTFSQYKPADTTIVGSKDTMQVLTLMVHSSATYEYTVTVCEGESYMDENFTIPTVKLTTVNPQKMRSETAFGCDSTIMMYLNILPIQRVEIFGLTCPGTPYIFGGKEIYQDGTYYDTTKSVTTGCDSISTLHLSYDQPSEDWLDKALCFGDSYTMKDGTVISAPGQYIESNVKATGCDSIIHWNVLVADASGIARDTIDVTELPYFFNNVEKLPLGTAAGSHDVTIPMSCGDGTLTIQVEQKTALRDILDDRNGVRKMIVNEQLIIIRDDKIYNAQGNQL